MLGTLGRGQTLIADAAHDSDRLRDHLRSLGARAVVKPLRETRRQLSRPLKLAATRIWLRDYEPLSLYQPPLSVTHDGDSQSSRAVIHHGKQARVGARIFSA